MSTIIPIDSVISRIRAEPEDRDEVEKMLASAVKEASNYMQRNIYATTEDLESAIDAAELEMDDVFSQRALIVESDATEQRKSLSLERLNSRVYEVEKTARGVVLDESIEAAILLITGSLYAHREDIVVGETAVEIPRSAKHFLRYYRVMGV